MSESGSTPLKILFVTSDRFPPFRPAAKAIFGDELVRRGHTVDWLLQAESSETSAGPRPFGGGTAYIAPTDEGTSRLRRLRKYWLDFRNDLRMFGLLAKGDYSLIQVKDRYLTALLALVAARRHRVPLFYWLAFPHAEASVYAAEQGVARYRYFYLVRGRLQRWLLYRVIMPAADHVFVQSEQMRRDIAAEGIVFEKMTPVPSSLNFGEIVAAEAVPLAAKPADEKWVLYLGTLMRERRLDFLVRAFALLLPKVPNVRLVFVGEGENPADEAALRDEAAQLGIAGQVTITGWLEMHEAWSYVRAADVCVSPYAPVQILQSTSPTKLVEYMAFGKPVVANDHPEQSEVVRESGGGIVFGWDEAECAEALAQVLLDPERARAMGEAGRRYVERWRTHAAMADVVLERYRRQLAVYPEGSKARPAMRPVGKSE